MRRQALFLLAVLVGFVSGCRPSGSFVVVYTSQDQVYAEPILHEFTRQAGIQVRVVYDSEAVKTVGLANRLLAEREHPQCDLFWSNEEMRTRQLAVRNLFDTANGWAAVGYRSRRLIVNTNLLSHDQAPRSFRELTNSAWRGKVALAYPLFGTTSAHFLALRQAWGAERWEAWCRALEANRPMVLDGNSVVARMVARGEAWIGMTDSDDIAAEQRNGQPVAALPLAEDSMLIPNTIAVLRQAPHPDAARRLFDYLRGGEVAGRLVDVHALEAASPGEAALVTLKPDWSLLVRELEPATETLRRIFLR